MAPRPRQADDPLGEGRLPRPPAPRIPPPADGPQGLAEPERPVGLRDQARRTTSSRKRFDGKILVPFPVESALSGVAKQVGPDNRLWYRRTFTVPDGWNGKRILLHFGAVDWDTTVSVNGKQVGTHRGGYDPFTFDITDALQTKARRAGNRRQRLRPHRRQLAAARQAGPPARRHLYTPTTGIWQTVWLEPVPRGVHRLAADHARHRHGRGAGRSSRSRRRRRRQSSSWSTSRRVDRDVETGTVRTG